MRLDGRDTMSISAHIYCWRTCTALAVTYLPQLRTTFDLCRHQQVQGSVRCPPRHCLIHLSKANQQALLCLKQGKGNNDKNVTVNSTSLQSALRLVFAGYHISTGHKHLSTQASVFHRLPNFHRTQTSLNTGNSALSREAVFGWSSPAVQPCS